MYRILTLTLFSLMLSLTSCHTAPSNQPSIPTVEMDAGSISASTITPQGVADQFIAAGVSPKRLEQIKQDLITTAKNIKNKGTAEMSLESMNSILQEIEISIQGIDIAKNTPRKSRD